MGKRSLALASAFGLASLLWALATLQGVFIKERDDALTELSARQVLLEDYAERALREELAGRLVDARERIASARLDPLVPASDLYLSIAGEQILPRVWAFLPEEETPARTLHEALIADRLGAQDVAAGSPWAERVALLQRFRQALAGGESEDIEGRFREILRHRSHFVLPVKQSLPFDLALLEIFRAQASPASDLLRMLLRDGFAVGTRELEGTQRTLLLGRSRFGEEDFAFLVERVEVLSESASVPYSDFSVRASETPGQVLNLELSDDRSVFHGQGDWYIEAKSNGRSMGIRAPLEDLLAQIAVGMKRRGLLAANDELRTRDAVAPVQALDELRLLVASLTWNVRTEEIQRLFALKTLLGVSFALLAVTVAVLIAIIYRRGERLLELKSDFIATVSHELRTPLASIRIQAETLERRVSDLPGARDYPARIISDIDRLGFLVDNILSFNRLEKGSWKPLLSVHSLCEIADDLRQDLSRIADSEIRLRTSGLEEMRLEADPDLLRLLFLNLARNSCKYAMQDPIEIEIRVQGGAIRYRDNGVGIAPEMWKKVFDDFVRVSQTPKTTGAGLGLAICRRVMEAHDGHIAIIESSKSGSTFEIVFGPGSLRGPA